MKKNELPDLTDYSIQEIIKNKESMIIFLYKKDKSFLLDMTGEMETAPEIGDLAILWDTGKEWKAIVAVLADKEFAADYRNHPYKASTQEWYDNAIRFRDPEQLNKIVKWRPHVAKE